MVVTFSNIKGGTGKSSITSSVARTLAVAGKKVLVIDLDLQANSTQTILSKKLESEGKNLDINESIFRTIVNRQDIIPFATTHPNLFIAPASFALWEADFLIYAQVELEGQSKHFHLKNAIDKIKNDYDFILIDVSNYPGIVTMNAFCASDYVIGVTTPGAYETLGIKSLLTIVNLIKQNYNSNLLMKGVLLNKVELHLKSHQESIHKFKSDTDLNSLLFTTMIRKNTDMQKAQENDMTVMEYNRYSSSGKDIAAFVTEAFLM